MSYRPTMFITDAENGRNFDFKSYVEKFMLH